MTSAPRSHGAVVGDLHATAAVALLMAGFVLAALTASGESARCGEEAPARAAAQAQAGSGGDGAALSDPGIGAAGSSPAVAAAVGEATPADAVAEDRGDRAPWVVDGKPVPDWALYPYAEAPDARAPTPGTPAKQQSWWNRILFPSEHCPYCGRRVPTKKGSYFFLLLGLLGQIGFTSRFLVQWIASERARKSVVPESFWWLSIVGSLMLLIYALSIWAVPIVLGQAPNVLIYARNLYFIHKHKKESVIG